MEDLRARLNQYRRYNNARVRNKTNINTNQQTITNINDGQVKEWLQKEELDKMSLHQKKQSS